MNIQSETQILLMQLAKKIDEVKIQIEVLKKQNQNTALLSQLSEMVDVIDGIPSLSELLAMKQELSDTILNNSVVIPIQTIGFNVTGILEEMQTNYDNIYELLTNQTATISQNNDSLSTSLTAFNTTLTSLYNAADANTTLITNVLAQASDNNDELQTIKSAVSQVSSNINIMQGNCPTSIPALINSLDADVANKFTNLNTNVETLIGGLDDSVNTSIETISTKLDSMDEKLDALLENFDITVIPGGDTGGGETGYDEYTEPDLTELITSYDKNLDRHYYTGMHVTESAPITFKCNSGEMLVISVKPQITLSTSDNLTLKLYLNDTLAETYNYTTITSFENAIVYVTQGVNQINEIKIAAQTTDASTTITLKNILYEIYGKNVDILNDNFTYNIKPHIGAYMITKNTPEYVGYANFTKAETFDQNALTYTAINNVAGCEYVSFVATKVALDDVFNAVDTNRSMLEINTVNKTFKLLDANYYNRYVGSNTVVYDMTCHRYDQSSSILIIGEFDGIFQCKEFYTMSTNLPVNSSSRPIPFSDTETLLTAHIITHNTMENMGALELDGVITTKSGNNYLNHTLYSIKETRPIVPLGYGKQVKLCYLNSNLDMGVYMKVYGKYILRRLYGIKSTTIPLRSNSSFVLLPESYVIGEYDELHPGIMGEYFTVKNGNIEKHTLPAELTANIPVSVA